MNARIINAVKFDPFFPVPRGGFQIEILRFGIIWVPLCVNGVALFYKTKEDAEKTISLLEKSGSPV